MSSLPSESPRKPPGDAGPGISPATAELARRIRGLADRYRHLSESRLRARLDPDDTSDPDRTCAGAGLALARTLAALGDAPEGREVPDVGVFAVGDQIAVTGLDLVAYLERGPARAAETTANTALTAVRALAARV
ncbi:hypothetical protein LO772_20665 [Yinghuangia sp. ASG 101]|uniref:hypothetical protein n=1 Tax=Yinghuangia sp. ASG 101 TaxID=2896848 RepID=UPI001E48632B|nr:hypothetical protein [Yinghuangia sp. ASG 101]UGQ09348.1 hypothetical protein LO772_20665 [Yinghuangia sp. ASG 101]